MIKSLLGLALSFTHSTASLIPPNPVLWVEHPSEDTIEFLVCDESTGRDCRILGEASFDRQMVEAVRDSLPTQIEGVRPWLRQIDRFSVAGKGVLSGALASAFLIAIFDIPLTEIEEYVPLTVALAGSSLAWGVPKLVKYERTKAIAAANVIRTGLNQQATLTPDEFKTLVLKLGPALKRFASRRYCVLALSPAALDVNKPPR